MTRLKKLTNEAAQALIYAPELAEVLPAGAEVFMVPASRDSTDTFALVCVSPAQVLYLCESNGELVLKGRADFEP